jgi:hypothetical protein
MPVYSIEEEIQTERQLEQARFAVYFTLTTGADKDDPMELRNRAFGFIQRIAKQQGKPPKYWFAVCRNERPEQPGEALYHVHGFLGDIDGFPDIQQLRKCWRKSIRQRDPKTGAYKTRQRKLGRSDFQRLTGDPFVFGYVVGQMAMEPCTNVALLKPASIRHQVDVECGEVEYAA